MIRVSSLLTTILVLMMIGLSFIHGAWYAIRYAEAMPLIGQEGMYDLEIFGRSESWYFGEDEGE